MVEARLTRALGNAGIPVFGVSVGDDADRTTWVINYRPEATAQHRIDGEAMRQTFDPTSTAAVDAEITDNAQSGSRRKDILAIIAWAIRLKDQAAWAALTLAQKRATVLSEADNWRDIRVFIEKNL